MRHKTSTAGTVQAFLPLLTFLLLSTSLEILLSISAVLFNIGASSPVLTVIYFALETLYIIIPSFTAVYLLCYMRRTGAPLLLILTLLTYLLLTLLLNVIKTMFFCHFWSDVFWDTEICIPYLRDALCGTLNAPFFSIFAVLILTLFLYYAVTKRMQGNRPLRLSPASSRASAAYTIVCLFFFLRASYIELTGSLLPYIEDVQLGYMKAEIVDIAYIAFKFIFYLLCAVTAYLIAHRFDRRANANS